MKTTRRVLSWLLCIAMLLGVFQMSAFAAEKTTLKSVYASYAAEGHTNEPLTDETFHVEGDKATISILTTTDMHGRAYDWNSYTNSRLDNNFLQAAQIIAKERSDKDDSIVVDVGDIMQGSALTSYNNTQEVAKNSPVGTALRTIGYDVFTLGNHEFNYSPEQQWNFYNYLTDTASTVGKPVSVVCANVVENETQQSVFAPYKLFPYEFADGTTYTIGVLCFDNMNNANWDVSSHYEGCSFSHAGNENNTYVYEYETYWQKELAEKCDYLIVAMHTGEGSTETYNQENQAAWFIEHTTGVDLVLTGHNHRSGVYADNYKNKDGKVVPVMNGGGAGVAELELELSKGENGAAVTAGTPIMHTFSKEAPRANAADFVSGNEYYDSLKALLKESFEKADAFVNQTIGTAAGEWDGLGDHHYVQTNSYDVVHQAQIWAATTSTGIDPTKEHVVSMTSNVSNWSFQIGSLFKEGETTAPISLRDCYSLYRYDNNTLFMIRITGEKLLNWMQVTTMNYKVNGSGFSGAGFGTDQFYGLNYSVHTQNSDGHRVCAVTYADGTPVQPEDEIYLCMSSYRLSATADSDAYGWFAATGITSSSPEVVWDATVSDEFNTVGGSVPLIIGEYIKHLTAEGKQLTPYRETSWTLTNDKAFTDVYPGKWYTNDVNTVAEEGLFEGYPDGRFGVNDTLTRAQLVTVMARDVEPDEGECPFTDVDPETYFYKPMMACYQAEIVFGTSATTFSPDMTVSREQFATILYRLAKVNEIESTTGLTDEWIAEQLKAFPDADRVASWARESMAWCVAKGIIRGCGTTNSTLSPKKDLTRAEAATMIVRFANGIKE